MKSVAKYSEQVRTVFCAECGGIAIEDMPIKDAQQLARTQAKVCCQECGTYAREVRDLNDAMDVRIAGHAAAMEVRQKGFEEDMKMMSAQIEVAKGALEQIRLKRLQQYDWQSRTN